MKFVSTRGKSPPVSFSEAILRGAPPDGGLYVPERFPVAELARFEKLDAIPDIARELLRPFLEGDPLERELGGICERALDFPIPLRELARETSVLELFHGPTAAFKDVGARFLAECLGQRKLTILVATSGDTGSAVAAAFHGKPGIEVAILFPKGGVSARQERQLCCWDGNISSFRVRGTFDDCQRLVKAALAAPDWLEGRELSSANSINVGRLLPQAVYYAAASLRYHRARGFAPGIVVPSGNLGNAVAAFWARKMGFPIREIWLAVNANRPVARYFETGKFAPEPSVRTLANAMDVGNPSNMERLLHLHPDPAALREIAGAVQAGDEEIRDTIRRGPERWGETWCPHTATAVYARETRESPHWIIVATAHPAKFETVVEPLVGHEVAVPPALAAMLSREQRFSELEPDLAKLRAALEAPRG